MGWFTRRVGEYFDKHPGLSLDSEAISTDKDAYKPYGSLAGIVAEELTRQGINVKNKSWSLSRKNGTYILYLTDTKLTNDDIGKDDVGCTRYDIASGEITKGTVGIKGKSVQGEKYPYISQGNFKRDE